MGKRLANKLVKPLSPLARRNEVYYDSKLKGYKYTRESNSAGGIEARISNGRPIVVRAALKPISTLGKPVESVDLRTKKPCDASYERSDVMAVPAAGRVGEAVAAFIIADAFLDKFGGDSMKEVRRNYEGYMDQISRM